MEERHFEREMSRILFFTHCGVSRNFCWISRNVFMVWKNYLNSWHWKFENYYLDTYFVPLFTIYGRPKVGQFDETKSCMIELKIFLRKKYKNLPFLKISKICCFKSVWEIFVCWKICHIVIDPICLVVFNLDLGWFACSLQYKIWIDDS